MTELAARLEELGRLVAAASEGPAAPCALAAVVADLEQLAGVDRGGDDPPTVLARRFAQAHRALLGAPELPADVDRRLRWHAEILCDSTAALLAAWNDWQDLRRRAAPLVARVTALDYVHLARRALCR